MRSLPGRGITEPIHTPAAEDEARPVDVSIVICTYNRCGLLVRALESLENQEAADVRYEVLVVDNNSSDETRNITQRFVEKKPGRFRYVFEPKQGLSYARNAGIAKARAENIAFTDDDVRVASNWVSRIKAGFGAEPIADFLGGKVLPDWGCTPPEWLTREHWAPLALVDYGDQPFYVDSGRPFPSSEPIVLSAKEPSSRWVFFTPTFSGSRMASVRWRIMNCFCGFGRLAAREFICPILLSRPKSSLSVCGRLTIANGTRDMAVFMPFFTPTCWSAQSGGKSSACPLIFIVRLSRTGCDGRSVSSWDSGIRRSVTKFE